MKRAEYVESEFKKWEEMYEINYIQEYDVKLLLSLRHQLEETPDNNVKTKIDLINAINMLTKGLNLKPKQVEHNDKTEILLVVDTVTDVREKVGIIADLINKENVLSIRVSNGVGKIITKTHTIYVRSATDDLMGYRVNGHILKMSSIRDVAELSNK